MTDLILAVLHHLLIFAIAGILAAEAGLLRPGMTGAQLRPLSALDAAYGIAAVLILIVGFARVFYGLRGPAVFLDNHWFWTKIAAFVVVGLLSAPPTVKFAAWRKRAKDDASFVTTADDVRWVRRFFLAEAIVFAFIPALAAAMVRVPSM